MGILEAGKRNTLADMIIDGMEYKSKIVMVFGLLSDIHVGWASRGIIEKSVFQKHTTSGHILTSPLDYKILIMNLQDPNIYLPNNHPKLPVLAVKSTGRFARSFT